MPPLFDPATLPKPLAAEDDMPEVLKEYLKKVKKCMEVAKPVHDLYMERWDELYGLYRSYRRLKSAFNDAPDRDKGGLLLSAKKTWGEELFIPWAYATVETVVPRLLSNDPKMLMRARNPDARESAMSVQELINADQATIGYDLKLQPTARRGLKYGLGVQKTGWKKQTRTIVQVVPSASGNGGYAAAPTEVVLYEGPDVEDVDIWDFFWDPVATCVADARWLLHRTWRDDEYVENMVKSGKWYPLDTEAVKRLKSDGGRDSTWAGRMEAQGLDSNTLKNGLHEVWEYHNGQHVYTILDQCLVVQAAESPYFHREMPFQIFRPTPVEGEFVGIGEIEPIAHLQRELNVLRGQRRDNATMALMRAFIYREGRADPSTFRLGPGVGIPVQGDPRADIVPLEFPDLPASSYREEDAIKADIELASGIAETVTGAQGDGGSSETATGTQLVMQAANVRIRLKTKNLERETIRPAARQFLELYRQHIFDPQKPRQVRVDDPQAQDGYRFTAVGPEQLNDDIDDPIPDAGSTEPDNPLEREQRATQIFQSTAGDPVVDPRQRILYYLKDMGVKDPESFLVAEEVKVDPRIIAAALQKLGVPEELIEEAVAASIEAEQAAEDEEQGQPVQGAPA